VEFLASVVLRDGVVQQDRPAAGRQPTDEGMAADGGAVRADAPLSNGWMAR
jgi:hypothetical protein